MSFFTLAAAAALLVGATRRVATASRPLAGALVFGALLLATASDLLGQNATKKSPGVPSLRRDDGYVGSGACAECHPSATHSFSQSYHKSMTRLASSVAWDGVRSPQLPARLEYRGRLFELDRAPPPNDQKILAKGPDLHALARALSAWRGDNDPPFDNWLREAPLVEREIVLLTGSHHYLAFWLEHGAEKELRQLPFVYLLDEQTFRLRDEVFLQPPDARPHIARFNGACIQCHAVAGRPREFEGAFRTDTAELGIACEACHGPGGAHSARLRSPFSRHEARRDRSEAVMNPSTLSPRASSALCGQCHAYFTPRDPNNWWENGFRTPSRLSAFEEELPELFDRYLLTWEQPERADEVGLTHELTSMFWPDGTVIVGGREYNGLIRSACYTQGYGSRQLGCLDCHSMHDSAPDDQLKGDVGSACANCHEGPARDAHSGHPPEVACVDCHMPKTSYALRKAIRSHRITVPGATETAPPSACVLCHSASTRMELETGYAKLYPSRSRRLPPLATESELPLALELALSGNAIVRAILLENLVDPALSRPAHQLASRPVLETLSNDPYAVVRQMAQRGLAKVPPHDKQGLALPPPILDHLTRQRDETPLLISE